LRSLTSIGLHDPGACAQPNATGPDGCLLDCRAC
jgi:hypothetical protein